MKQEKEKINKTNGMLCSVLVNIDQQKKVVINKFCYVSENIIVSNLNMTNIF